MTGGVCWMDQGLLVPGLAVRLGAAGALKLGLQSVFGLGGRFQFGSFDLRFDLGGSLLGRWDTE